MTTFPPHLAGSQRYIIRHRRRHRHHGPRVSDESADRRHQLAVREGGAPTGRRLIKMSSFAKSTVGRRIVYPVSDFSSARSRSALPRSVVATRHNLDCQQRGGSSRGSSRYGYLVSNSRKTDNDSSMVGDTSRRIAARLSAGKRSENATASTPDAAGISVGRGTIRAYLFPVPRLSGARY